MNIRKLFSYLNILYKKSICGCLVARLCPTVCGPMDWSLLGSSVHGDSPGKNTGVGCPSLLQEIFLTEGSSPGLPHCRQIVCYLSYKGIFPYKGSQGGTSGKGPSCQCNRWKSCILDPWMGKIPWRSEWLPLQYCCLEDPMDREIWQATIHWVSKNGIRLTWLSTHSFINTTGDN